MWGLIYLRAENKREISVVTAEPTWNQIDGYSIAIVSVWQVWINGSGITIADIPYFCLSQTKFVINIWIKFFVQNLRFTIYCTTNHNYCSTICNWSMGTSASFEISMKWPFIVFIFCNDWWTRRSTRGFTSNEKRSLIRGWNRVMRITP